MRGSPLRLVLMVAAVVATILIGISQAESLTANPKLIKPYDFVEYWCAGRLLLDGRDPYDADALVPMQKSMYDGVIKAIMMWNPPWALPLTMPFAALPWRIAHLLWVAMQMAAIMVSVDLLWRIYGGSTKYRWVSWLISMTFAPTLFLLFMGQISGLLLLGLAGFLYFLRNERPYAAGGLAILTALKPHHLSLFALLLILEATRDRRIRKVIIAGAITLLVCSLLPMLWNPHVWQDYREALRRPSSDTFETMEEFAHSTLGYKIREAMPGAPFKAMFIPVIIAMIGTFIYWWRRSAPWSWERTLPFVTLICILATPYGAWSFDMVLLLLPLIQMAVWVGQSGSKTLIGCSIAVMLVLNGLTLMTIREVGSQSNPWIALVVFGAYCCMALSMRTARRSSEVRST